MDVKLNCILRLIQYECEVLFVIIINKCCIHCGRLAMLTSNEIEGRSDDVLWIRDSLMLPQV